MHLHKIAAYKLLSLYKNILPPLLQQIYYIDNTIAMIKSFKAKYTLKIPLYVEWFLVNVILFKTNVWCI